MDGAILADFYKNPFRFLIALILAKYGSYLINMLNLVKPSSFFCSLKATEKSSANHHYYYHTAPVGTLYYVRKLYACASIYML